MCVPGGGNLNDANIAHLKRGLDSRNKAFYLSIVQRLRFVYLRSGPLSCVVCSFVQIYKLMSNFCYLVAVGMGTAIVISYAKLSIAQEKPLLTQPNRALVLKVRLTQLVAPTPALPALFSQTLQVAPAHKLTKNRYF